MNVRRPLLVYGGLALVLGTVDLALPAHGRGVPLVALAVVLGLGIREGIRAHRPQSRAPWFLLLGTVVLADVGVAIHAAVGHSELNMPMASDAMVVAALVGWGGASALFVRARSRVLDRYQLLDLGIILVSATVALKRLVLDPSMAAHPPQGMSPSLAMSMVLLEVVALVLFVRFVTLKGPHPVAMWLVLSSLGTSLLSSVFSNLLSPETGLHLGLYLSGTATMLGALHPTMAQLTEPSPGTEPTFGPVRAALLGVAVLLPPVTAALVHARTDDLPILWFLTPTFVVTTLVLLRLRLQFAHERQAQAELAASRAQFRALIHGISDVIVLLGRNDRVLYASASSATTLGQDNDLLVGRLVGELVHPDDAALAASIAAAVRDSNASATVQVRAAVGHELRTFEATFTGRVDDPNIRGVILVLHDVTERQRLEARLRHQALHDGLTGLPNRVLLTDRVAEALQGDDEVGVLFVDLDDFKAVNDGLGHELGDRLLRAVGARLVGAVRDQDLVARLGGDEFAVLVGGDGAVEVATRLLDALVEPFELSGHRITVSASIGVASGACAVEDLLRNADVAMYRAKADGKGSLAVFERGMQERASERLLVQLELADALERDQLRIVYQPIYQLSTGRLTGAEALLRWDHPERGLLGPDRFIQVAEETGQIVAIGEWVLAEACRQAAGWPGDVHVAVNLSARQLESDAIVEHVLGALAGSGVAPSRLVLEITETMLARDIDATAAHLSRLTSLGVRIAIDDFGTGYSSLSTLSRFPVDVLKIDRSFIASMLANPDASALVHVLVEMG
ncbi:MAG: putative diguanylate cyclase (GGDEF)/phosphodiesterase with sensor, partial [Actinomycetia bacterium]|nr:putative diguanylate cyclase (GGDEF)/phosphodiesterase with sensor [Actinomycetes bacterium]